MKVKDDYARVGVPMLPVVAGNQVVARQIVLYSWVMVAVSLLLWRPLGVHRPGSTRWSRWSLGALLAEGGARAADPGQGRGDRARSSRRCGCSTGRSPTCRCCSSPSRWTPSCADVRRTDRPARGAWAGHAPRPSPFGYPSVASWPWQTRRQVDEHRPTTAPGDAKAERRAARLAQQIDAFAKAHGGAEGQVAYIGQRGARIVLVGEDGAWGDLVAPTYADRPSRPCEGAGVTVHETFDGEFAAKVRTGPYEWTRMAGIQVGGRAAEPPATPAPAFTR